MPTLISSPAKVEEAVGLPLKEAFLEPTLSLDAPDSMCPKIVVLDSEARLLFLREIEKGSVQALNLPGDMTPQYYAPYFSWDQEHNPTPGSLAEAIAGWVAPGEELRVEAELDLGLWQALSQRLALRLEGQWLEPPVGVYTLAKEPVLHAVQEARAGVEDWAIRVTAEWPQGPLLRSYLQPVGPNHFELLDSLIADQGLEGLLLTSPLNIQELTGISAWLVPRGSCALYRSGDEAVTLISPDQVHGLSVIGQSPSLREALASLGAAARGGTWGLEEACIEIGRVRALGFEDAPWKPMTRKLRRWREGLAGNNLGLYIFAAQAVRYAIETALAVCEVRLGCGLATSERQVARIFHDYLQAYSSEQELPLRAHIGHINLHAAGRTMYPSVPSDWMLKPEDRTIKLDAGAYVVDANNVIHAYADLCRTLIYTAQGKALYQALEKAETLGAIPAIRAGMSATEAHRASTAALDQYAGLLDASGLVPDHSSFTQAYSRYTGHALNKQRIAGMNFKPGEDGEFLTEGYICCLEFPWPCRAHSVSVEDMFLVTIKGGVNLARPVDVVT